MTQYPVALEMRTTAKGTAIKATTSVDRVLDGARSLEEELRCIEIDYRTALAAAKEALASAGTGRFRNARSYWFAGKYVAEFIDRLGSRGFYLVGKNKTPAEHLGISKSSVAKMIAFYRRYPDPFEIDVSTPWSVYRDNKERRG